MINNKMINRNILISNKFKKILRKMSTQSYIAQRLLNIRKEDINIDINYIDINIDTNRITYMISEKVRLWEQKFLGENRVKSIPNRYYWNNKSRITSKSGSFVNKIFKGCDGRDIEKFASVLKAVINTPEFEFRIESGNILRKLYHYSSHHRNSGPLGVSCMRHDTCQPFFNLYIDNPTEIKMLVMKNNESGLLMGRALLWNLGKDNGLDEEFKFMDRIYCTNDDEMNHFFNWADENGYCYKERQSWGTPHRFKNKDGLFSKELKFKLKNWKYWNPLTSKGKGLPYLDTFKWIDYKTGYFANYKGDNKSTTFLASSTNGSVYGYNYLRFDKFNSEYDYEGSMKYVDYVDSLIISKKAILSKVNNRWAIDEHLVYDERLDSCVFKEEYKHLNNTKLINKKIEIIKKREEERRIRLKMEINEAYKFLSKYREVNALVYENTDFSFTREINNTLRKQEMNSYNTIV